MFEEFVRILRHYCAPCVDQPAALLDRIQGYNPSQSTVLWFQFVVALLSIIWIVYQFTWLRRLNEARLEEYLEEKLITDREDLARERSDTLAALERVVESRGVDHIIAKAWANLMLIASLFMQLLRLGRIKDPVSFAMLLLRVGRKDQARSVFSKAAQAAVRLAKLHVAAAEKKKFEAQNSLIFSARVAMLQGRQEVAANALREAIRIKDDPDARILIGRQLAQGQDLKGALAEFNAVLEGSPATAAPVDAQPTTKAEAHRRIAEVYMIEQSQWRARRELTKAKAIELPTNYSGLAKTNEMIGDLYAPRPYFRGRAQSAYREASHHFDLAGDRQAVARVAQKLRRLNQTESTRRDSWQVRLLTKMGEALLKRAERLRARAQMTVD